MTYAYRGEDQTKSGKKGRTPAEVKQAGGFKPWQIATVEQARTALTKLAVNGTLEEEARKWCLSKNKENGWFFSTGISQNAAYDNYDFLYRMNVSRLAECKWNLAGLGTPKNVDKMVLYMDTAQVSSSAQIAVIWQAPGRKEELLIMSPVPVAYIELQKSKGLFIPLTQWT
jgi:hypothetical protein